MTYIIGYNLIKIFQEIKFSLIFAINLLKDFIRMKLIKKFCLIFSQINKT